MADKHPDGREHFLVGCRRRRFTHAPGGMIEQETSLDGLNHDELHVFPNIEHDFRKNMNLASYSSKLKTNFLILNQLFSILKPIFILD